MRALVGLVGLLCLALSACQPGSNGSANTEVKAVASDAPKPTATTAGTPACFIEGLDASGASEADRLILQQAAADFCAVLAGQPPVHAKPDDGPRPADGGTQFYVARHYKLTVMRSLSTFGTAHGMVVGPVLSFNSDFAPGNSQTISATRIVLSPKR